MDARFFEGGSVLGEVVKTEPLFNVGVSPEHHVRRAGRVVDTGTVQVVRVETALPGQVKVKVKLRVNLHGDYLA